MDVDQLKRSWDLVARRGGDQVASRFYSYLFIVYPETRSMFPLSMAAQRDRLVNALGYTVSHVDELDSLVPFLEQLGRDHRKFGVTDDHYPLVGQALLHTLAETHGDSWNPALAENWAAAYGVVAKVMTDAAAAAEGQGVPAWWQAEVVAHERRTIDIAVVTVRPEPYYHYESGQSLSLETHLRPRVWRYYSPANAPRPDGTLELHVRQQPGGPISTALVSATRVGDLVTVGPPVGAKLKLAHAPSGDLMMISGGTGLAPLRAIAEAVANEDRGRRLTFLACARTQDDLYDLPALYALADKYDWFTVRPVVTGGGQFGYGEIENPAHVAMSYRDWYDRHIFICGSDLMVADTVRELSQRGASRSRLHYEGFTGLGGDQFGVVDREDQQ